MHSLTIAQVMTDTRHILESVDVRLLLQHVLNVEHAFLLTHSEYELTSAQKQSFLQLLERRIQGVPVAYLIGKRDFYDLTFKVNEAVLIPRSETELLVELALEKIPSDRLYRILDLGTGSGAIALTLAKHRPLAQMVAVDVSPAALAVCRENARILQVDNVCCVTGSWFDELSGERFDLIVSNPPYVAHGDPHLQRGDLRFEPQVALVAEGSGLACIQHIIAAAPQYLVKMGWLLLEHGHDQTEACRELLQQADFSNMCSHPDLAGIMRVSGGQMRS